MVHNPILSTIQGTSSPFLKERHFTVLESMKILESPCLKGAIFATREHVSKRGKDTFPAQITQNRDVQGSVEGWKNQPGLTTINKIY